MPTENVNIDGLAITFHDMYYDYFLEPPGVTKKDYYIVEIAGVKFGFGSRMQLQKGLTTLKQENPSGIVPANSIMVKPIPKLSEPLVRRLGSVLCGPGNPDAATVGVKISPDPEKAPAAKPEVVVKERKRETPGAVFDKGMSPASITTTNISEGQGYDASASPGVGAWW